MAYRSQKGLPINECIGYKWNTGERLGGGSYGEVYKGRSTKTGGEVAVKVVDKSLFRQDPKAEENLRREIRIQKQLVNSEYVVSLYHVEEIQKLNVKAIVMVMELCECDLDHLLKVRPFHDKDIIILLHQLGEGMKALRAQNIVHRDLKPGNILIKFHPRTGKMMIKLADFGFARIFTDEAMKPLDLTSLAGTPVFMAPEALRCVFNPGVEHYDDKVDLWSIGALLYKVIVGQCGFYAQLNHIVPILSKKKDAIAWMPSSTPSFDGVPVVKYIYELPPDVDDRLSPPFKQKMNTLLRSLLKLERFERMTFPEFFDFVDDLIKSKVEIVNLLHGTSFKFMMEQGMTTDQLIGDVEAATGTPITEQILFCSQCDLYIAANSLLVEQDFNMFMNRSGGSQGHSVLYFVPTNEVRSQQFEPHYDPLAKLYYLVQSKTECVRLIREYKYAEEVVHSLNVLYKQIERQFSCIEDFQSFVSKQLGNIDYLEDMKDEVVQHQAKAALALDWLKTDLDCYSRSSNPLLSSMTHECQSKLQMLTTYKEEIDSGWQAIQKQFSECKDSISEFRMDDISDLLDNTKQLQKEAKQLAGKRKEFIFQSCEELFSLCKGVIVSATERAHKLLGVLYNIVSVAWGLSDRVKYVKEAMVKLNQLVSVTLPNWRSGIMHSISQVSAGSPMQPPHVQSGPSAEGVDELRQQLASFCLEAEKMTNPTGEDAMSSPSSIYPPLENSGGFVVIEPERIEKLVPRARRFVKTLKDQLQSGVSSGASSTAASVKIARFDDYNPGDVVMFHPIMVDRSKGVIWNNLLHLHKPKPFGFLHPDCYTDTFGFKRGRVGDLFIGQITKVPEEHKFAEEPSVAQTLGVKDLNTSFYYIWAENPAVNFHHVKPSKPRPAPVSSPMGHPLANAAATGGSTWAHPAGPRRFH